MIDKLNRIVWQERQRKEKPDLKPIGNDWLMDTMPFNALLKEDLQKEKPLQYLCEGKYISFKPVGGLPIKSELRADKRSVSYRDALGVGISIEVEVSQSHWKKLIKIDSLNALGDLTGKEFIEYTFEVESDFDIPEGENKKPRIKLGENSYIEVSQAWDSTPEIINEETGEISKNKITVRSFFKREGGSLYFTKQIPTDWLKTAIYPVWSDVDIVYGTAQEFGDTNHSCRDCQCCEIDTDKFVVVWRDADDADAGDARVGTVSGTTITWGAINEFYSDVSVGKQIGVCKLDTNKFVVVYSGSGDDGYARVASVISDRTIIWGTAKEFETGDTEYPSCCQLGTDKFAIIYNDEDAGDLGTVCICTVSDKTITAGTPVAFEGYIQYTRCCKLDTDKFVAFYRDVGDNDYAKACAFSVVGTVPTAGTILLVDASYSQHHDCCQLDTDKCAIAWTLWPSNVGKVEILTASGTTLTEGAEVEYDDGYYAALAKMDSSHFILTYRDTANSNKGTSRYCSFSGTTISLDGGDIFNDAYTNYIDVCLISADKIAVVYQDAGDVNGIGEAIIGDVSVVVAPTVSTVAADNIEQVAANPKGNVTATGEENPTRYIDYDIDSGAPYAYTKDCGIGGIGVYNSNLTGLIPGKKYYYRARAVNSGGTGTGSEMTFTTKSRAVSANMAAKMIARGFI